MLAAGADSDADGDREGSLRTSHIGHRYTSSMGELGGTYRLKQETCDENLSFAYDMYYNSVLSCIEGGIGATWFYQSIQPKYSLNLDLILPFSKKIFIPLMWIVNNRLGIYTYNK